MSGRDPLPREQAYEGVKAENPPDIIVGKRDPIASDFRYPLGTIWINTVARTSFQLLGYPPGWAPLAAALLFNITTLRGDTGVTDANLTEVRVIGGANLSTAALGNALTLNVSANPIFTSMTASGDIKTTTGKMSAALGNIETAAGDIQSGRNLIAANQLQLRGGLPGKFIGQAALVSGTVVVANVNILSSDRVYLQRININGSISLGELTYTINPGVSLIVTSVKPSAPALVENNDKSIVAYVIIRQI